MDKIKTLNDMVASAITVAASIPMGEADRVARLNPLVKLIMDFAYENFGDLTEEDSDCLVAFYKANGPRYGDISVLTENARPFTAMRHLMAHGVMFYPSDLGEVWPIWVKRHISVVDKLQADEEAERKKPWKVGDPWVLGQTVSPS